MKRLEGTWSKPFVNAYTKQEINEKFEELTDKIDILNQGGLELKEDFIGNQVYEWLHEHPEATTTVQDGVISEQKIDSSFLPYIKAEYVTPQMYGAKGDGIQDDSTAIQNAFNSHRPVYIPAGTYLLNSTVIVYMDCKTIMCDRGAYFKLGSVTKAFVFGDYRNVWNNAFLYWSGGTILCENKDESIGFEVLRYAKGATIDSLHITDVGDNGYGITILKDDTESSSIQLNLKNIRVTGSDSNLNNTGIYCNAYDLYSSNIYVYQTKKGIVFTKSEWQIDFYHYWFHRPADEVVSATVYKESVAVESAGNIEFGNLYIDMACTGVVIKKGKLTANKVHYISIKDELIDDNLDFTVFNVSTYANIAVNNLTIDSSRTTDNKINVSKTTGMGAVYRHSIICNNAIQSKEKIIPYDLAFDCINNKTFCLLNNNYTIPASSYVLGYVACVPGTLTLNISTNNNTLRSIVELSSTNEKVAIRSVQSLTKSFDFSYAISSESIVKDDITYFQLILTIPDSITSAIAISGAGQGVFCPVTNEKLTEYTGEILDSTKSLFISSPVLSMTEITWTGNVSKGFQYIDVGVPQTNDYYIATNIYQSYTSKTPLHITTHFYNNVTGKLSVVSDDDYENVSITLQIYMLLRNKAYIS